ncbi:competence protein ComEC [Allostella vacuolata]|nr:competence protein ComEC [Stella vacuolata]
MIAVDAAAEREGLLARGLAALRGDAERWPLWVPVGFGLGIAAYFSLADEPAPWLGSAVVLLLALAAWWLRHLAPARIAIAVLAAPAIGFAAIQISAQIAEAPRVERRMAATGIEGRIVHAGPRENGIRLTIAPERIDGWTGPLPRRLRITVGQRLAAPLAAGAEPGRRVAMRAVLLPLPPPSAPGAFDFPRQGYFQGLGGLGYATTPPRLLEMGEGGGIGEAIAGLRQAITSRIQSTIGGAAGAVAAALVTGERGAIPEAVNVAMRDTGLAHLLSISGLHISLVAGIVFLGLRTLLALIPGLALHRPIKKWSAAGAILAAFFYLLLSGAEVPTQRSFLMSAIVFAAVLVDREAISLRLVAWAAGAILLLSPEAMVGASFQMSFAAVLALVAAYEAARERIRGLRAGLGAPGRILLYVGLVCFTTVIATAATTPFALYHFNRFAAFAMPANLIAVPLTSFWVMPWAVIAVLAMPFGLEAWPLAAMGWGVEAILRAAAWIARWPGAAWTVPAMPDFGLALCALGGLWLCLWRHAMRWAGLAAIAAGLLGIGWVQPPDVLVDGDGRAVAVGGPGGYWVFETRQAEIAVDTWLRRAAADRLEWPEAARGGLPSCDARLCRFRARGERIVIARRRDALTEACRSADIVIALVPMRWDCGRGVVALDRRELERGGAHAIRLGGGRPRVTTVAEQRGRRPWTGTEPGAEDQ